MVAGCKVVGVIESPALTPKEMVFASELLTENKQYPLLLGMYSFIKLPSND